MANPTKWESQLADVSDNPLIGAQQTKVSDITITYTTGDPSITPNNAVTVANGATPTVNELLELGEELVAKVAAIIDVLEAHGLSSDT